MTRLSIALIFTAIILAGCPSEDADPWSPVERITDVVWADDQTKIAYVSERYEEKVEGTAPYLNVQTRNHRYSVFVANPDGSDARERLAAQPTRPLGELRYYAGRDLLLIHDARENGRAAWIHYPDGSSENTPKQWSVHVMVPSSRHSLHQVGLGWCWSVEMKIQDVSKIRQPTLQFPF